jgi:hypothetical protein
MEVTHLRTQLVERVADAIGVTCGRCHGKGSERHQVSRDPADGYEDHCCPSCRGSGLVVGMPFTVQGVSEAAVGAVLALLESDEKEPQSAPAAESEAS